jgi:hypothetical protein
MFPFYHEVSDLDLSKYQIFSKDQLDRYKEDEVFTDHCFINCMKYHEISDLDLSKYQIFSKDKLDSYKEDEVFTDHCFINCMKYYRVDEDTIEFAQVIIKDVLPFQYLDKLCHELNISCEIAFVVDTGH